MDVTNKRLLLIALIIGLTASGLVYWYITKLEAEKQQLDPSKKIIVANLNILPKTVITKEMIGWKEVKESSLPVVYLEDEQQVVGQIAKETIYAGEPITSQRLADEAYRKTHMAYLIPKGYRALTLRYTPVMGVGGFIIPGDYVDVIGTYQPDYNAYDKDISKVILQNVLVLAVQDQTEDTTNKDHAVTTITLAVTPEQAEKLTYTEERASIRLMLRPLNEKGRTSTSGVTKDNIITP